MHNHLIKLVSISILALTSFATHAAIKNTNSGLTFWNVTDETPLATYINGNDKREHRLPPHSRMGIRFNLPLEENASLRLSIEHGSCKLDDFGKRANRFKECEAAFFGFGTQSGNSCEFDTVGFNCPMTALHQRERISVPIIKTTNK